VRLTLNGSAVSLGLGVEDELLAGLGGAAPDSTEIAVTGAAPASKTFDLLLEVELPVSVSFGRTQVPLRDALKLSTGSILELNRAITEPVEIIVNNCVIARGEVVVVEGNFGVRIQEVVSRQERLRTLQ
jgi:flagellar motor switch protein FliN/FliY